MGHGGDTPPFLKSVPRIFLRDSNENLKVDRAKKMFTQTRSLCRFKSTSDIREWHGRQNAQTRLECWEMRGDEYGDNVYTGAHTLPMPSSFLAKILQNLSTELPDTFITWSVSRQDYVPITQKRYTGSIYLDLRSSLTFPFYTEETN